MKTNTMQLDVSLPLTLDYEYLPREGRFSADVELIDVKLGFESILDILPEDFLVNLEARLLHIHTEEN